MIKSYRNNGLTKSCNIIQDAITRNTKTMIKNYRKHLEKEIIRKAEVADMIGCHINSVSNYVKRQGLPIHRKKGAHPYFLASEVKRWIEE